MQVYTRNTEQHRKKLLPFKQISNGSADTQAQDFEAEVVKVVEVVEERKEADANGTPEHQPLEAVETGKNESDEEGVVEGKQYQDVDNTAAVQDSQTLGGTEAVENRQVMNDKAQMNAGRRQSGYTLPPILRQRAPPVGPTQDSDFEATQVGRGRKRKMSQVERCIVVRKKYSKH
eukprot:gb/GEZJ01001167.1/.p3 GENE.gb/GEZJ01001167.1/~~gb/GEZJ01001167.1/.p3  ORF type:complete len:175 (+),score=33.47 gb/GEZJ01001167.1/:3097-3621(+)